MRFIRFSSMAAGIAALALLSACAPTRQAGSPPVKAALPACVAAAPGDALVGNWLSVTAQKGVAGAVRTLYTLKPDGSMMYVEQVKRPRSPSQGLEESGCWSRDGKTLVLRTLRSNGVPVNLQDPIYTNRLQVQRADANQLLLKDSQGVTVRAKRMSPGYRLPF